MHYGWIIVAASVVIGVCGYGTYFSFTLFYPHLVAEFGWSRAVISGAMSVGLIAYGSFAMPVGWCVDRFGPRLTIGIGGAVFGCGTALGSLVTEAWHLYALYGGVTAVGMGAAWAPLVSTISRWFEARRGLAVGLGSIGGGTGTFFMAPLVDLLIAELGWRTAYVWIGIISGGLITLAALFLIRDPQSRGLLPYGAGDPRRRGHGGAEDTVRQGMTAEAPGFETMASIMRTWLFWRVTLTFGLWWFAGAIVYVQIAPFILERGFDLALAALALVFFGLGNAFGKIVMGLTGDRFGDLVAYRIGMILAAGAMLGLALLDSRLSILTMCAVVGFGFGGASTQLTTISAGLFGLKVIGALMGTLLALVGLIGAGGPLVSGMIFDSGGSYVPAYLLGAAVFIGSLAMSFALKR